MLMANGLKRYFPMIRDKAEILNDIYKSAALTAVYKSWNEEQQEKFISYCTGMKGIKLLYDAFLLDNNDVNIENELEAWLTFLSVDEPDIIIKLIEKYPRFKSLYDEVYYLCLNMKKVMRMFSKELLELDKNTVLYMIDEMQDEIDAQKRELEFRKQENVAQKLELDAQKQENAAQKLELDAQKQENAAQKLEIGRLQAKLRNLGK